MGGAPLKHDQIFVYGHIRSVRADVDKSRMITLMAKAVGDAAKAQSSRSVWVYVAELPPRQMIEFGHLLPEAGDEQAWTAALPASESRVYAVDREVAVSGSRLVTSKRGRVE
jgi:hypothetical protein